MILTRPLCFLDVESTGVDPVRDRIIELGVSVIPTDPQVARFRWSMRFNPGIPIPAEATAVHGITDADVASCPKFQDEARKIYGALHGKDLAGYNIWRLDLPILDEELRRAGYRLPLHEDTRVIDAYGIFSKKESRKLEDAVRIYCGREHAGAHSAGDDADATADVLLGQLAKYPDLAAMDLAQLAEFSRIGDRPPVDVAGKLYRDDSGALCFGFGKHKDARVRDQAGYAHWMDRCGDFPGSTMDAIAAELGWG